MIHVTNTDYLILIIAAILSTLAKIGTMLIAYRQYRITRKHYRMHHNTDSERKVTTHAH
jgi:hypothetical protein